MANLFLANFDSGVPAGVTTVNTDSGNLLTTSGQYESGLYMRNDNSDGFGILGCYSDEGIEAAVGRRWEIEFYIRDTVNGESILLGISTAGVGMANTALTTQCSIYHGTINAGGNANKVGTLASFVSEPDNMAPFVEVSGTLYTGILETQEDGTVNAYYIDSGNPGVEVFLGSNRQGATENKNFTPGTLVYFSVQCASEWMSGNIGGLTVNNIRVYDTIFPDSDGENLLVLGHL